MLLRRATHATNYLYSTSLVQFVLIRSAFSSLHEMILV